MWKPRPEDSIDTHIHIQMGIKSQKAPTQSLTCLRCRAQWFAYVNAFGYGGIFRLLRSSLLCLSLSHFVSEPYVYVTEWVCPYIKPIHRRWISHQCLWIFHEWMVWCVLYHRKEIGNTAFCLSNCQKCRVQPVCCIKCQWMETFQTFKWKTL